MACWRCPCLNLYNLWVSYIMCNRELEWQMKLRWLIIWHRDGAMTLDYLDGPTEIIRIFKVEERGREPESMKEIRQKYGSKVRETWNVNLALCANFEGGRRRSWAKECGWLLDNGKGKEMDFSPEDFKKEHSPSNNLGFSPVRPISDVSP